MTARETAVAAVLADHDDPPGWTCTDDGAPVYECTCGDQSLPLTQDYIEPKDAQAAATWHRAHVAAAIVAALAQPTNTPGAHPCCTHCGTGCSGHHERACDTCTLRAIADAAARQLGASVGEAS